jgi:hypothetical protein
MGALIPNGNDAEVIGKLNSVFSGSNLTKLRQHIKIKNDDVFHGERNLHRISHRLKIAPTSGAKARGRWYVFLRDLIGADTQKKILKGIGDAVSDSKCEGIRFWARLEPGIEKDYDAEIVADQADATGRHWVTITMLCDHEINPTLPGDPSTPPPDQGEAGPQHPLLASTTKTGAARKQGTKKAAKKAAKKAVKKAAKKKR